MSNAVLTSPHFRPFLCVLYCFRVEGSQPLLVALCGLLSSVQPYEQAKLFHLNNITPDILYINRLDSTSVTTEYKDNNSA